MGTSISRLLCATSRDIFEAPPFTQVHLYLAAVQCASLPALPIHPDKDQGHPPNPTARADSRRRGNMLFWHGWSFSRSGVRGSYPVRSRCGRTWRPLGYVRKVRSAPLSNTCPPLTQGLPSRYRGIRLFRLSAGTSKLVRYQTKKPARLSSGRPCGSYWIRTSDLFHVKEAL